MNYSVQAYTIHVGDVLASTGSKVVLVTNGPSHIVIGTEDGNSYIIPNNKLVGIKE